MKVLFASRSTIFTVPGGDTNHMKCTAEKLKEFGVEAKIYDPAEEISFEDYDLIHFFNLTRPAVILDLIKRSGLPYVVSPIYMDYSFYSKLKGVSLMGMMGKVFDKDALEYIKSVGKHFLRGEKIEHLPYFWRGQKNSIKEVLKGCSHLIPNSNSEHQRLLESYPNTIPCTVVPNGVDLDHFDQSIQVDKKKKHLLCAALIEPRKNQLNLIRAVNGTSYTLTIVGSCAPNHKEYLQTCIAEAGPNVKIIQNRVPWEELMPMYKEAEIHILPSWFETCGLSSLEAAYMDCKVVVAPNGDTRDYYKEWVEYCDPGDVQSIFEAIERSHNKPLNTGLKEEIDISYNWRNAAKLSAEAYRKVEI